MPFSRPFRTNPLQMDGLRRYTECFAWDATCGRTSALASEISADDDGYPWLSWALTGVLTLAGVLIFGLVISAHNPRLPPPVPHGGTVEGAKSPPRPAASAESPAASSAPAAPTVHASPSATGLPSAAAAPVVRKESPPPAAAAVPGVLTPRPDVRGNQVLATQVPPPVPQGNGPASPPLSATVNVPPESVAANPAGAAQDAAKRVAFVRAVAAVRAAMGRRNLAASKQNLQTAAANVQCPADQAELERLQILQDHLEQFWNGIRKTVAAMQASEEIVLSDSNRVAVIEASREELTVQREGRPQRWRIEAIPMDMLLTIVKNSFQPTAGSKLIFGSFLAMDAQGDRAAADKLWQEAIRGGESQGNLLLPELNIARTGHGKP